MPRQRVGDCIVETRSLRMAGFTLIEVLVAFVIAVLALGALYRAVSTGFAAGSAAENYSHALLIAESTLDAVGTAEKPLAPGNSTRRLDGVFDEQLSVRQRPDLLPGANPIVSVYPYEISVVVAWRDGRRERSVALSTIRLGPPP